MFDPERREWVVEAAARADALRKGLKDPFPYVEDHEYLETRGAHDLLLLADACLELLGKLDEVPNLVRAVRTGLTWLARPSDLPPQHAETLIRATEEMREALAAWED